jgi:hypothetical protein
MPEAARKDLDLIISSENAPLSVVNKTEQKKEKSFMPMLHGKATKAMAQLTGRPLQIDEITRRGKVESKDGVILAFNTLDRLSLSVSTHKLLCTAIAVFTDQNHTGAGNQRDLRTLRVAIPLKKYALWCGYDVQEYDNLTPEDKEKQDKRIKTNLDNARKTVKKDILQLLDARLEWKETVKGKSQDFVNFRILGAGGIKSGIIVLEFSASWAEYLLQLPITQFSIALLAIDNRNETAYKLAIAFLLHSNNDNNILKGTADRLKVQTLLSYTSLPNPKDNGEYVKRQGWWDRSKEPFENALDILHKIGFLESWEYCRKNGEKILDEEASEKGFFSSCEEWTETLVKFKIENAPSHTARLEAKKEKTESKKRKAKRKTDSKKEGE